MQSENHGFTLLMSHLACAEIPDHPMNDRQIRLFREIRLLYRGVSSSLANSSGIFLGGSAYCDLVRPGVALYGVNPTPGKKNPMRPVVELKGRIIQVRPVNKGETVGYGAAGKRCPIAGRVSMDLLAVDVTDLAEGAARRGDLATLIGDGISVDELAAGMGTIGYEVLTNLGQRYHRVYKGE